MAVRIVDPHDDRLSDYRQLRDVAARRRIEGDEFFIAEGPVAIERLLASAHRVRSVLVSHQQLERLTPLFQRNPNVTVYSIDRDHLTEVAGFDLHRGAIAAADRRPQPSVHQLALSARRLAVLEGLNDPENLGLIARSARALGVDGLILDPTCIDPYTRRTVRVSMGEILHVPWARALPAEWPDTTLGVVRDAGFEVWAMTPAGDAVDVWSLPVPDRVAMCLGAEGPGLSDAALRACDTRVVVPIRDDVDSLNVAASAAVVDRPGTVHG